MLFRGRMKQKRSVRPALIPIEVPREAQKAFVCSYSGQFDPRVGGRENPYRSLEGIGYQL